MSIQDSFQAFNGHRRVAAKSSTAIPRRVEITGDPGAAEWYRELAALKARLSSKPSTAAVSVVATCRLPAKKRAAVAVSFLNGEVQLKPTITEAAAIFDVSASYINRAKRGVFDQPSKPKLKPHDQLKDLVAKATFEQIVALVRSDPERFWQAFEAATTTTAASLVTAYRNGNGHHPRAGVSVSL